MDMLTLAMAKSYTDSKRLGYIETKRKTIIPETVVVVNEETPLNFVPVVGEKYTIVIDGTVYEDTAVLGRITGAGDAVCLGNDLLFDGNDTGQPFFIAYVPAAQICAVNVLAGDGENATISIYQETETIHPIDPKFLPGVCLPVVEITSAEYPTSGRVRMSEEERAKFEERVVAGTPVIVKVAFGGASVPATFVANLVCAEPEFWMYNASFTYMSQTLEFMFSGTIGSEVPAYMGFEYA